MRRTFCVLTALAVMAGAGVMPAAAESTLSSAASSENSKSSSSAAQTAGYFCQPPHRVFHWGGSACGHSAGSLHSSRKKTKTDPIRSAAAPLVGTAALCSYPYNVNRT